jgi:predicted nucleic acid-binding protein
MTTNLIATKPIRVTRFFADSNVLLYSVGLPSPKARRAGELLLDGPVVSVQVLNEFMRVATKKLQMPFEVAVLALSPIRLGSEVVSLTLETHEVAMEIVRLHNIQIFDANNIAAAQLAGCDILYTEDMHHGQRIGTVTICNPFLVE